MIDFHMLKKMKKTGAVCLAALFSLCLLPTVPVPAASFSEQYVVTQSEVFSWLSQNLGNSIDYDGAYGAQNTDLIKAYYEFLGVAPAAGNAAAYRNNELPNGFQRIRGGSPLPGDILIYTGGYYGHISIYEADHITWHQGFGTDTVIRLTNDYRAVSGSLTYWGLIRPVFAGIQEAAASDSGSGLGGEGFTVPGKLRQGVGFTTEGTVTDTENILSVRAGVYRADGQEVISASARPNAEQFSLAELSEDIMVSSLNCGVYEYRVTGEDSGGFRVLVSEPFIITARARTIPDGRYKIASCLDESYMLSIAGRSVLPGANIRIFRYLAADLSQDFYFTYQSDGYYCAVNRKSGLYMTAKEARADGSLPVVQAEESGGDDQLFQVLTDGADSWYLAPKTEESVLLRVAGGIAYNTADLDAGPVTLGEECRFVFYDTFAGFRDLQNEAAHQ